MEEENLTETSQSDPEAHLTDEPVGTEKIVPKTPFYQPTRDISILFNAALMETLFSSTFDAIGYGAGAPRPVQGAE